MSKFACHPGWFFVLPALLMSLGCDDGPEIVPVSGQVLIDGKP